MYFSPGNSNNLIYKLANHAVVKYVKFFELPISHFRFIYDSVHVFSHILNLSHVLKTHEPSELVQ